MSNDRSQLTVPKASPPIGGAIIAVSVVAVLCVAFFAARLLMMSAGDTTAPSSSSPPSSTSIGTWTQTLLTAPLCRNRDTIEKLDKLRHDEVAFETFLQQQITLGECWLISKGQRVYVEHTSFWSSEACLRPEGEAVCYWTGLSAIEKPAAK